MHRETKTFRILLLATLALCLAIGTGGCSRSGIDHPLVVYSGKGLSNAMEEAKTAFQQRHKIPVTIIYAGSDTLLSTIQRTRRGDIFIPGSATYIQRAGDLIRSDKYVADHIPAFIVRADNPKNLQTFADLLADGVKLAVGNKDMCAIGRVAEKIIAASDQQAAFRKNIVITGSTVNELLQLVNDREVDAALAWTDMLKWPGAAGLRGVAIPEAINSPKEIRVTVLAFSTDAQRAALFADFLTTEGKAIFTRHGFGVR